MTHPTLPADFETLVACHHAAVWHSARRVVRSADEAEDVTQEVFLRVLDGRLELAADDDSTSHQRVLSWWAIRLALNTLRAAKRRRAREDAHAMESETFEPRTDSNEGERLWSHVEALPHELRVPLVLRFAEGSAFGTIGETLGIAESTAYERVQRGLGQLRRVLERAGLAALALQLEGRLVHLSPDGFEPGSAPAGLAARLVALESARGAAAGGAAALGWKATGWPLASALVLGVAVAGGLAAALSPPGVTMPANSASVARIATGPGSASPAAASPVDDTPALDSRRRAAHASSAPAETPSADDTDQDPDGPHGVAIGRIVDGARQPIAGCEVSVVSMERQGKMAAHGASASTDDRGRFRIPVELAEPGGGHYRVQAVHAAYAGVWSEPLRLRADRATDFGDLAVRAGDELGAGAYALTVNVMDPSGVPVAGARVLVASVAALPLPTGFPSLKWLHRGDRLECQDGRGVSDAAGLAAFRGERVGRKTVSVVAPDAAYAPQLVRFSVSDGANMELTVVLEPARSITGRVRVIDGTLAPSHASTLQLHVVESVTGEWRFAAIAPDGSFRLDGLSEDVYRLHARHDPGGMDQPRLAAGWVDLPGGTSGADIALKRENDPRDIGIHAAELHGRIVDAERGAPLALSHWALDVERVTIEPGVDVERDWLPNHLFQPPYQRAAFGTVPDDSDEFHRTGLEGGTFVVRCASRGWAVLAHGPITLGPREIVDGLVIEMRRPCRLGGRVLGPDGEGLDGAFVFVTGVGPDSDRTVAGADQGYREVDGRGFFFANGSGRRAEGGAFELTSLPPEIAFRVVAVHPEFEPAIGPVLTLDVNRTLPDVEVRFTQPR